MKVEQPLVFLGVPAVLLVVLAVLPPGRIALAGLGLGVVAAVGALAWPGGEGAVTGVLLSAFLALVVALATLVQLSRHMRRSAPMNTMLALVAILTLLAVLAIYLLSGI